MKKKGQNKPETQRQDAPQDSGHSHRETHDEHAHEVQEGEGYGDHETQCPHALPTVVAALREVQAQRQPVLRQQNGIDNRCRAMARRYCGWQWDADEKAREGINAKAQKLVAAVQKGTKPPKGLEEAAEIIRPFCEASLQGRAPFDKRRRVLDKALVDLAVQLPVWPWVEAIRGVGAMGLGLIVAEAGDLAGYDNPAKLWKRLGLAVIDGRAQRRVKDPEQALRHGYNPRRRSMTWNIGQSLIKQNGSDGYYKKLYDERKAYELARPDKPEKFTPAWAHHRAQRYMEKRFLRELWAEWNAMGHTGTYYEDNPQSGGQGSYETHEPLAAQGME